MNIILKSFDGSVHDNPFLERAFQGIELGTCISVSNDDFALPNLGAKNHLRISANNMRDGNYEGTDWNVMPALDATLIQSMRHCEGSFMTMMERYVVHGDIPYHKRKRLYLQHLRYWNYMLEHYKIDLLLLNHAPHQCYDYVLYNLCKLKGIRTLNLERAAMIDAFFVWKDWEQTGTDIRDRYEEIKREYADSSKEIPLSENYEAYFKMHTEESPEPWFMATYEKHEVPQSFVSRWSGKALNLLRRNPKAFFRAIFSADLWAKKLRQHRSFHYYFKNAKVPDLTKPYVYMALQYQPEMSTAPLAGAFVDQELMVQLLAACLPKDVLIYVKEHPMQDERCRSEAFYKTMLDIPSVTFVPKNLPTFQLIDNAAAVASATGTVGFQAIFKQKPVFMFGHRFFQFAPGIHRIRSMEDCKQAVQSIFGRKEKPSLRELRMYMKAIQDTSTPYTGTPHPPHETLTQEEKAQGMGVAIGRAVRKEMGLSPVGASK